MEYELTEHNCVEDTVALQTRDFSHFPQQGCFVTSLTFAVFLSVYEGKCPLKTRHGSCVCVCTKKGRVYRIYKHIKALILLLFSEYFSEEIFSRFPVHVSDMNQILRRWMESSGFPWSRL